MRTSFNGSSLRKGDIITADDYNIEIDTYPHEIAKNFENTKDAPKNSIRYLNTTRRHIMDEIPHINAVARALEEDPNELDDNRLEAQVEDGTLKMSSVWEGDWEGRKAATCQERAITLNLLYKQLGLTSKYQQGQIKLENGIWSEHGWTTVKTEQTEYISDPSKSGDGVIPVKDRDRYSPGNIIIE